MIGINDHDALGTLLKSWNQEYLYEYLLDEKIDINVLKIMRPHHIVQLFRDFKLGDQIIFEHNLTIWRRQIGKPLSSNNSSGGGLLPAVTPTPTPIVSPNTTKINVAETPTSVTPNENPINAKITRFPPQWDEINLSSFINLSSIVNETAKGKLIVDFYRTHHRFGKEQRVMLINLIASYFEQNRIHLSLPKSYRLEQEIVQMFPNEAIEHYRNPSVKRGKIYIKYCNLKKNFKSLTQTEKKPETGVAGISFAPPHDNGNSPVEEIKEYPKGSNESNIKMEYDLNLIE